MEVCGVPLVCPFPDSRVKGKSVFFVQRQGLKGMLNGV